MILLLLIAALMGLGFLLGYYTGTNQAHLAAQIAADKRIALFQKKHSKWLLKRAMEMVREEQDKDYSTFSQEQRTF